MNAAADQDQDLGLTYGKALTDDQAANLKQDMVWMVETQVNGEKVLAPIVYLSAATKSMFDKGDATIAANEANMNLTSLTNTRSEEHTSEIQSLMRISYAVFCLKKKTKQNTTAKHNQ